MDDQNTVWQPIEPTFRHRVKNILVSLVACSLVLLLLTSCGVSSQESNAVPTPTATPTPATITLPAKMEWVDSTTWQYIGYVIDYQEVAPGKNVSTLTTVSVNCSGYPQPIIIHTDVEAASLTMDATGTLTVSAVSFYLGWPDKEYPYSTALTLTGQIQHTSAFTLYSSDFQGIQSYPFSSASHGVQSLQASFAAIHCPSI